MAESILIIGKSKTGESLAQAIRGKDRKKLAAIFSARMGRYPVIQSDIVIIATKDAAIPSASKKALASALKTPKIMVHLAGSLPSTILPSRKGMARLTLHPIQTFSEPKGDLLHGIYWMASSDSSKALHWARRFVADLDGKGLIILPSEALPLYHAMTVFSSNFITLLFSAIEEMADELGQNPRRIKAALRPLAENALKNVLAMDAKVALTGPIKRKDFETIQKNQNALKKLDPKLRAIYDAFLDHALRRK